MAKAATDKYFSSQEKEELGLPVVGPDVGGGGTKSHIAVSIDGSSHRSFVGGSGAGSSDDPLPGVGTSIEIGQSSLGVAAAEASTEIGGAADPHDSHEELRGGGEQPVVKRSGATAANNTSAEARERCVGGSACGNGPPQEREA